MLYSGTITSPRAVEDVFDYLADFTTNPQWDPGTRSATRLDSGALGLGSEFRLVVTFLRRTTEITYRITEFDRPNAVTLRGENAGAVSTDRITFAAQAAGTSLTYVAELSLKGWTRLAAPLVAREFRRVGDNALAGLRRELGAV